MQLNRRKYFVNNFRGGYFGKQLRVSLDSKKIVKENIEASILRKYLGGAGYAVKVLYDEIPQGIDPLSS